MLKQRYAQSLIYTYVSHMLIVINPFRELYLTTTETVLRYRTSLPGSPRDVWVVITASYSMVRCSRFPLSWEAGLCTFGHVHFCMACG